MYAMDAGAARDISRCRGRLAQDHGELQREHRQFQHIRIGPSNDKGVRSKSNTETRSSASRPPARSRLSACGEAVRDVGGAYRLQPFTLLLPSPIHTLAVTRALNVLFRV